MFDQLFHSVSCPLFSCFTVPSILSPAPLSFPGTTPVYFAAQEGRLEALRFLHTKGKCDLNIPSEDGLKPIHAACQCGHTNIVKVAKGILPYLAELYCHPLHSTASKYGLFFMLQMKVPTACVNYFLLALCIIGTFYSAL